MASPRPSSTRPGTAKRTSAAIPLILSGILTLALVLRLSALLSLTTTPYYHFLMLDEKVYHQWATQIASGSYAPSGAYVFAPFPAYLFAAIYKLFSADPLYVRILNIFLGTLTCFLIYRIGTVLGNQRIGLVACLIAALYKPLIFYSVVPLKTTLSVFLFATAIYLFLAVLRNPSLKETLLLGCVSGLLLTTRENAAVLIPVMLGMILWTAYRNNSSVTKISTPLIGFVVGLTIATAPFALRNYKASGEFVLTTHQAGFNLYLGNNLDNPDPYYRPVPFASSNPYEQGIQFTIEASRRVGHTLSPAESSSYWIHEVAKTALTYPAASMWKLWEKSLVFLNRFEAGDHYSIDFMSQFATFFQFPFPELALILPLGMAGMATVGFTSRQALGASLAFIAYAGTLIMFFTSDRYRLPLLTLLIPFTAVGLNNLRLHIRQARFKSIAIYSGVAILFGIVEYLPVQATDDVTAYYNLHANLLDEKGSKKEAMAYWETSSSMNKPFSAFANLRLAQKYLSQNDSKRGGSYLEKIPDNSFAAALKYELIGDLLFVQGQVTEAVAAYERSLAINSGRMKPRTKLVRIFEGIDRDRANRENEALRYISSFYKGP